MTTPTVSLTLEDRLDLMAAQLDAMADELRRQRETREKWQELTAELTPVARGALDVATRELADLEPDVTSDDVLRFLRTFVRTMPKLEAALLQLESAMDLMSEATSLGGAGMKKLSDTMAAAEDRGYFDNAAGVVESLKELTRPEVTALLRRVALSLQGLDDIRDTPSAVGLLRELRDPHVRLAMARTLAVLRAVGADPNVPIER